MISWLLLIPIASATSLVSRLELNARQAQPNNYAQVSGNITQTITDVIALNQTVSSYGYNETDIGDGLLNTAIGADNLASDLQATTAAAQGSSIFTLAQSQNAYLSLTGVIQPTFDLLNNLVAHCNTYANIGLGSAFAGILQSQRDLVQQEGDALAAKVQGPFPQSVSFGAGLILSRFDSAISVFQQTSCPPPGSTAFPDGGGSPSTTTITVTATSCASSGAKTTTVTKTASAFTTTKTITTGVTKPATTKTITITKGGSVTKTVTKSPTKSITVTKGPTKSITITKGPTKSVTVTRHVTKTSTVSGHCPGKPVPPKTTKPPTYPPSYPPRYGGGH
ncbi:hypothetical protein FH972_026314 [Carpinus fangiana]|uniref:Uncharacterized protein n=1 Tax=Carpinus fangiana TaxID=176857 RepID=A0A5N6L3Z1_9ROSI|nr:hypothetical protein FH972_026314 [Carpinus fangiana]